MWDQCLALLGLKWTLLWRTMTTAKWISAGVTVAMLLFTIIGSVFLSILMFLAGVRWIPADDPFVAFIVIDVFVGVFIFLWLFGLMIELQRSDAIDLRAMLFLPISIPMVFMLNFIVSLLSFSFIMFSPALFALLAGLTVRHGFPMLLSFPLGLAFLFMLASWAYYIRGYIALLMQNKRRRRVILTVLPLAFALMGQLPNILMQSGRYFGDRFPQISNVELETIVAYGNMAVPFGWFPYGIYSLLNHQPGFNLLCFIALLAMGFLGYWLGYRSTVRFYTGNVGGEKKVRVVKHNQWGRIPFTARPLAFLPNDLGGLVRAEYLAYIRHPQIRLLLIMPVCIALFFLFMYSGVQRGQGVWLPLVLLAWPFLNFGVMLFNVFGLDPQAFRGLILLPVSRHRYFLAKNLALFPLVAGLSVVLVTLGTIFLQIPVKQLVISYTQILQLYLLFCMVGNTASIFFPYRISRNPLHNRSGRPMAIVYGLFSSLMIGLMTLPTAFCLFADDLAARVWGYQGWPIGPALSFVFLAVIGALYIYSLTPLGDLLLSREQKVLESLLRDRE